MRPPARLGRSPCLARRSTRPSWIYPNDRPWHTQGARLAEDGLDQGRTRRHRRRARGPRGGRSLHRPGPWRSALTGASRDLGHPAPPGRCMGRGSRGGIHTRGGRSCPGPRPGLSAERPRVRSCGAGLSAHGGVFRSRDAYPIWYSPESHRESTCQIIERCSRSFSLVLPPPKKSSRPARVESRNSGGNRPESLAGAFGHERPRR
jgi:hypothetical protein